jgi:hypothetical protein
MEHVNLEHLRVVHKLKCDVSSKLRIEGRHACFLHSFAKGGMSDGLMRINLPPKSVVLQAVVVVEKRPTQIYTHEFCPRFAEKCRVAPTARGDKLQ